LSERRQGISPARRAAFDILCRVEAGRAHSDDALRSGLAAELAQRDRNLATEIVYGTLRRRAQLDHVLLGSSSRPWEGVDAAVRTALRMALYQMWRMDRVPDHAVVSDAVDLVRTSASPGAGSFANAVLRALGRTRPWARPGFDESLPPAVRASLPDWLWRRWEARYGAGMATLFACSLNEAPASAALEEGSPFEAMDEASRLIPRLAEVRRGAAVWDACAAPGGKSMILRGMVGDEGLAVASDASLRRTRLLRERLEACGVEMPVLVADARRQPPFRRRFDAVLVDAPCSGTGTLRRNPEIKWRLFEDRLVKHHETQAAILSSVSEAVAPGGGLLYSTCSTEPEENEMVVDRFLGLHHEFRLCAVEARGEAGSWTDVRGFLRTFPSVRLWDGFFAALLRRRA